MRARINQSVPHVARAQTVFVGLIFSTGGYASLQWGALVPTPGELLFRATFGAISHVIGPHFS
jgi:hypothetical protein